MVMLVTGMPCAGKSELVRVCEDLGVSVVCMGDVVRAHARKHGIPERRVGEFADAERKRFGYDVWAERSIPLMKGGRIVIDGTRGRDEVNRFRKEFGDRMRVIAVHASPATRFERVRRRGRGDDALSFERFRERDEREMRWGISEVIALADIMVVNETSLQEFHAAARRIVSTLIDKDG